MCKRHHPKCEISMNQIQSELSECPRFNKSLWFSFIVEHTDVIFHIPFYLCFRSKKNWSLNRMSTREAFLVDEAFNAWTIVLLHLSPFHLTSVSARGDQGNFTRKESRHSGTIRRLRNPVSFTHFRSGFAHAVKEYMHCISFTCISIRVINEMNQNQKRPLPVCNIRAVIRSRPVKVPVVMPTTTGSVKRWFVRRRSRAHRPPQRQGRHQGRRQGRHQGRHRGVRHPLPS